jgi:hypothetical protein
MGMCYGRSEWKCILGGAAVGFIGGALIGNALTPQEKTHKEYRCSDFTGCGTHIVCDAHCDEASIKVWAFGISGAALGGIAGHLIAKANSNWDR